MTGKMGRDWPDMWGYRKLVCAKDHVAADEAPCSGRVTRHSYKAANRLER